MAIRLVSQWCLSTVSAVWDYWSMALMAVVCSWSEKRKTVPVYCPEMRPSPKSSAPPQRNEKEMYFFPWPNKTIWNSQPEIIPNKCERFRRKTILEMLRNQQQAILRTFPTALPLGMKSNAQNNFCFKEGHLFHLPGHATSINWVVN